jgi:hypothetical protein
MKTEALGLALIAALAMAGPAVAGSGQYVETARCLDVDIGDAYPSTISDTYVWPREGSDYRTMPAPPRKVWCRVDRVGPPLRPVAPIAYRAPLTPAPTILRKVDRPALWPDWRALLAEFIGERG